MINKIFLREKNSVFANNVESDIKIDLSTKARLLPNENVSKNISLIEQYNKERDACNKFRLIFSINPLCTNILHNSKTEIIINEGSSGATVVQDSVSGSVLKETYAVSATNSTSAVTYMDALRNTEYSHPDLGNFTYHCGLDIFNNHMLRNDGYVHVNKVFVDSDKSKYNTIKDFSRDYNGKIIKQDINMISSATTIGKTDMHLYTMDNIIPMKTAFRERCVERDGWWGFINSTNINLPNRDNDEVLTNTLIASKKPCSFIDLYPDRSLYSFIPKYNKFRNRIEKNWDYCLTYPYENDYDMINTICGADNFSIRVNFKEKVNSYGVEVLECYSYFNHNLQAGSKINIYFYKNGNDKIQFLGRTLTVENIGDAMGLNKNKIFTIKGSDVDNIIGELKDTNNNGFYFKKVNGKSECQYYFRKFKKLKNFDGSSLRSDINKVAFSKNIYGDDIAQIIFTDDIDATNLLDNNNRPVSEVYLTLIKRNAGHDIWYGSGNTSNIKSASTIEFSHCFGKVTSGLDFSGMKDEPLDYNIHKLHNLSIVEEVQSLCENFGKVEIEENTSGITFTGIDLNNYNITSSITINQNLDILRTFIMWGDNVFKKPAVLEDNISINNDIFYGDVVEYDNILARETIISSVYHRVNTAQRETFDECFRDILEDKIVADDYDIYSSETARTTNNNFEVKTYYLNNALSAGLEWRDNDLTEINNNINGEKGLIYGNIRPEGYYYNPHFKIQLKSNDSNVSEGGAIHINYNTDSGITVGNDTITFEYPTDYGFYAGDNIAFYNMLTNDTYWCEINGVNKAEHKITVKANVKMLKETGTLNGNEFKGSDVIYRAYYTPISVPGYARIVPEKSSFVWREIIPQSKMNKNDLLYDTTFANGRLYIEKNVNFYLRRQDPFGENGLSNPIFKKIVKVVSNPLDDFVLGGKKQTDFSSVIYNENNLDSCF